MHGVLLRLHYFHVVCDDVWMMVGTYSSEKVVEIAGRVCLPPSHFHPSSPIMNDAPCRVSTQHSTQHSSTYNISHKVKARARSSTFIDRVVCGWIAAAY